MSTIIATTLSNGSVSVPTATVVNGSAKAWVNLNGAGTIAVRDSFNVASLTDLGAGQYQANFSSAMSAANYAAPLSAEPADNTGGIPYNGVHAVSSTSVAARTTTVSAFSDSALVVISVFGDLA